MQKLNYTLNELYHLHKNSRNGKHEFLDLLEAINMQDTWEYEEVVGWSDNVFNQFAAQFDFNFRKLTPQLNKFVQSMMVSQ